MEREIGQEVLGEIVRRIVEVAQPEKIILFGSAVRGEMGPNSDVDLLVVKSGAHRRRLAKAIYMNLIGVGQAVDVADILRQPFTSTRLSTSDKLRMAAQDRPQERGRPQEPHGSGPLIPQGGWFYWGPSGKEAEGGRFVISNCGLSDG